MATLSFKTTDCLSIQHIQRWSEVGWVWIKPISSQHLPWEISPEIGHRIWQVPFIKDALVTHYCDCIQPGLSPPPSLSQTKDTWSLIVTPTHIHSFGVKLSGTQRHMDSGQLHGAHVSFLPSPLSHVFFSGLFLCSAGLPSCLIPASKYINKKHCMTMRSMANPLL